MYRDSNNEDVLVCRFAVLHSDEGQAIDTDDQANAGVNRSAIVKCMGKVWGSIGNLVNVDVSEDAKRRTLRCILPGHPSDPAVRNVIDAMVESDDKSLILSRFYEKYCAGSLQADAEWASFCTVAKEACGFLVGV